MKSSELVQSGLLACCVLAVCCRSAPNRSQPVDDDADGSSNGSDGRVIYDQRQTGKYNIRISIKDVAIIEMDQNGFGDGSFSDEDYYYDDADLTVKPIKFTTPKPATTTAGHYNDSVSATSSSNATTTPITTTTTTVATTQPEGASYSPNLLADIAASQAASTTKAASPTTAATTTTSSPTATATNPTTTPLATTTAHQTPSVVIVESTSTSPHSAPQPNSQWAPLYPTALAARSKHIPVHLALAVESKVPPAPNEKTAPTTTSLQQALQKAESVKLATLADDSKIFNFKMQRANKSPPQGMGAYARHCRHHQYRDLAGNCRIKRSSSFLRKLFSMFASFPFARVEHDHGNE